jgi:parvulin-like peptidyl-prolyl isomerase
VHRVAKSVLVITICAAFAFALAACSGSGPAKGNGGSGTDVAASVNGKSITLKEVDQSISQQAGGQIDKLSPLALANARLQALQGLIQSEALYQRAEKENLLPSDEEVTNAINQQKQAARVTEEEWQRRLKESGETEDSIRDKARRSLAIQKLIEKNIGKVTIRDGEVEEYYNANRERFVSPRGVGLAAIVVDPRDSAGQYPDDAKNEQDARTKIESIYALLKSGTADFATVARDRSEDPSLLRGGDLGFATEDDLRQNRFPQELIGNFFGPMPIGGLTQPIRFDDGRFYIFKLTDRRLQPENRTLESPGVRDEIKQALLDARKSILTDALGVVAMNETKIENNLAQNMLNDPSMLGGMQPVVPATGGNTGGGNTNAAGGAATPAASPAATGSPAAAASPVATSSPAATAASPAANTSPRR